MPFRRNFSAQSSMHLSTLEKYPFLYAKYYDVFSRLWCHHSAVSKKKTKKHRFENTQNAKKKEGNNGCDPDGRAFQRLVEEVGDVKTPPQFTNSSFLLRA